MKSKLGGEFFIKYGLIFAVPVMAYNMLSYLLGVGYMVSLTNLVIGFLLGAGLLVLTALKARKIKGGAISFAGLFKMLMPVVVVGSFLIVLNDVMLNKVVDPGLSDKLFEASVEKSAETMRFFGIDDERIEETKNTMRNAYKEGETQNKYSIIGVFGAWFNTALIWIIPVLIISLIVKKQPDLFNK